MILNIIFIIDRIESTDGGGLVIVCHCKGVSDRAIRKAVRGGACTHRDVARACQAGSHCGGCVDAVSEILNSERNESAAAALPSLAVSAG
jgi:bacterioferritin-associated ferredoxin